MKMLLQLRQLVTSQPQLPFRFPQLVRVFSGLNNSASCAGSGVCHGSPQFAGLAIAECVGAPTVD